MHKNITYIKNCLASFSGCQATITITETIVERIIFTCATVSHWTNHQLQFHKSFLRELFLLPGYNYNYKIYSSASYLRHNFVDHGICVIIAGLILSGPVSRDTARLSQRYPPIAR